MKSTPPKFFARPNFTPLKPFSSICLNTCMKLGRLQLYYYAKLFILWFPAPAFLIGLIHSLFTQQSVCGSIDYSMTVMWALMFLAHLTPYIRWFEIRFCPRGCGCKNHP